MPLVPKTPLDDFKIVKIVFGTYFILTLNTNIKIAAKWSKYKLEAEKSPKM